MRKGEQKRETKETSIAVSLDLDGSGASSIETRIPFLDHMLDAMARHGGFDLAVTADGDLRIDPHHTVEDIGIVIGEVLSAAAGDGSGMTRFAWCSIPMDESLAEVAMDFGGRGYFVWNGSFYGNLVGGIPTELFEHFFYSVCINAGITAHVRFSGRSDHHMCEAVFKAFGIALGKATAVGELKGVRSTKGTF